MSEDINDKKKSADIVSEPEAGLALKEESFCGSDSETDYDFQGKDFGYARTLDELEHALDEADSERNDPTKWISSVEFHTRLEKRYPWLR